MTLSIKCSDVGVNCEWGATAKTEKELMKKIKEHAKEEHGFKEIPSELYTKVKSSIKEV